jgi:hypothetical protein
MPNEVLGTHRQGLINAYGAHRQGPIEGLGCPQTGSYKCLIRSWVPSAGLIKENLSFSLSLSSKKEEKRKEKKTSF